MRRWLLLLVFFCLPAFPQTSHGPGRFSDVYLDNQQSTCLITTDANGKLIEACDGEVDIKDFQGVKYAPGYATGGIGTEGDPWTGVCDALNASYVSGDHWHFSRGVYSETSTCYLPDINKLTITGDGIDSSIIRCDMSGSGIAETCIIIEPASGSRLNIRNITLNVGGPFDSNDIVLQLGNITCQDGDNDGTVCSDSGDCTGGGTCYASNSSYLYLENLYITADSSVSTTVYQDATPLVITNANEGVINNLNVRGRGVETWGPVRLFEGELVNRGNLTFNGGTLTFMEDCFTVGDADTAIVNTIQFIGTKCVSFRERASGTVAWEIHHGAVGVNFLGVQAEQFETCWKINGDQGEVTIRDSWCSQFAGGRCNGDSACDQIASGCACDEYTSPSDDCVASDCTVVDGIAIDVVDDADEIKIEDNRFVIQECYNAPSHCGTMLKLRGDNHTIGFSGNAYYDFTEGTYIDWGTNEPTNAHIMQKTNDDQFDIHFSNRLFVHDTFEATTSMRLDRTGANPFFQFARGDTDFYRIYGIDDTKDYIAFSDPDGMGHTHRFYEDGDTTLFGDDTYIGTGTDADQCLYFNIGSAPDPEICWRETPDAIEISQDVTVTAGVLTVSAGHIVVDEDPKGYISFQANTTETGRIYGTSATPSFLSITDPDGAPGLFKFYTTTGGGINQGSLQMDGEIDSDGTGTNTFAGPVDVTGSVVATGDLTAGNIDCSSGLVTTDANGKLECAGRYYGEIYADGNTDSQTFTTTDTYYKVTNWDTNGLSSGMTPDHSNDKITVTNAGVYAVSASISFSGSNNADYHCSVWVDGVEQAHLEVERKLGAGGDIGNAGITGLADIGAGEDVDLRCKADTSSASFVMQHANLNIRSI